MKSEKRMRNQMSQYKMGPYRHTLRQSPFRSSFGKSKSYGGVVAGSDRKPDIKKNNNGK